MEGYNFKLGKFEHIYIYIYIYVYVYMYVCMYVCMYALSVKNTGEEVKEMIDGE